MRDVGGFENGEELPPLPDTDPPEDDLIQQ
jgi:hypothetical protein